MSDHRFHAAREYISRIADLGTLAATQEGLTSTSDNGREALVDAAKRRLADNVVANPAEQFAIEAIIIPGLRPVIDVRDGAFEVTEALWADLSGDEARRTRLRSLLPLVGRVEVPGHASAPYGGTGFVVGPDLVMTNRHVAELFTSGLGRKGLAFRPGVTSAVDFRREDASDASEAVPVDRVLMVHPYWDMALLKVGSLADREHATSCRLALGQPSELVGRRVAVIGYPAFDGRNDARVQMEVFRGRFDVKRLQPGYVGQPRDIGSFGRCVRALTHDASTLGGNSGSAVVDVESGAVLALHFAGRYLDANFAVPAAELARDERVVEAGVTFEADARGEPAATGAWWGQVEATGASGPDAAPDLGAVHGPSASREVTLIIPLEVTVRIGVPGPARTASDPAAPPSAAPPTRP